MRGWWKCPSGQACDPRWASLSIAERGLLWSLLDAADGSGEVPVGALSAYQTALAVSGRSDEGLVEAALMELLRLGLVTENDGALVFDLRGTEDSDAPPQKPQPRTPSTTPAAAGPIDRRTAMKRLHFQWTKRGLRAPEDRVRWLSTEEGRKYLEASGISRELAASIAAGDVSAVSAGVSDTVSADAEPVSADASGAVSGLSATVPPRTPSPERSERKRERNSPNPARAGDVSAVSAGVSDTVSADVQTAASADTQGVSTDVGEGGEASLSEYLFGLARDSEGGFVTSGSVDQQEAVADVFRRSGLDAGSLLGALRRPSEALAGVDMVTSRNLVSASMLAGRRSPDGTYPCTLAHSLVAWARTQSEPKTSAELANAERVAEETRAYIGPIREQGKRAKESMKAAVAGGWKPPALVVAEVSNG